MNLNIRVWDNEQHCFHYFDHLPLATELTSTESNRFILNLGTGFQDRLGKEVFVSDIAKGVVSVGCMKSSGQLGEIQYKPQYARYELRCSKLSVPLSLVQDLEIVGNLFEHPQLLLAELAS